MTQTFDGVVVFAGGGTGGHLYPGLAVAERLRERLKGRVRCTFICSDRPLDAEILKKAGATFTASCARPFSLRPLALARFMRTWGRAVREARGVLKAAKAEAGGRVVVVATGGFVSAPVAQAARVERAPLLLVNLDAVPGKANLFVARRARRTADGGVVSSIPVRGDRAGDWPVVGPIVRDIARGNGTREECRRRLGLATDIPVLMVTGGSQGAKSINALMTALAERESELFRPWQVLHQCGKGEEEAVRRGYGAAGLHATRVEVREFVDCMGDWWGAADLAVSRSGAGSVAEAWANRTPSVFLPYPYHKDEHQRWNAEPLAQAGGAIIERDRVEAAANNEGAGRAIASLMRDSARRESMRQSLAKLGASDGAAAVASRVAGLLGA